MMLRSLGFGAALLALIALVSIGFGDWTLIMKFAGYAGGGFLLLAAVFSGSLVSGDRMRANFSTETKEDRDTRLKWSTRFMLISLPNIAASFCMYYFTK